MGRVSSPSFLTSLSCQQGSNTPPSDKQNLKNFTSKISQNLKNKMSIATFEEAVETISNKMNKTMSNDELKEIYALYKQATVGDVNVDRPGMLDFKGKAKWDAWSGKKGTSQDDAKTKYVEYANEMVTKHGLSS